MLSEEPYIVKTYLFIFEFFIFQYGKKNLNCDEL